MKRALSLVLASLLLLTVVDCTKRPVKPVKKPGTGDSGETVDGKPLFGNVNLVRSAGNFLQNAFSGFRGAGKPVKLDRNSALLGMALIGAVILGFLVYYQNRPAKNRRQHLSPGTRGRYRA